MIYEGSFEIENDGETVVKYYAVDVAGNIEERQTIVIKIDKIAPVTEAILSPCPRKYYTNPVTVTLQALDELSGIENTFYIVDSDSTWNVYNAPFVVSRGGLHIVSFYSVDNAGNIETIKTVPFRILSYITEPVRPSR